jgi:hypothetical protein
MFWRKKRSFQRVILERKVAEAIKLGESHSGKEAVNLLIGTIQREEGEDVYRVYDIIPDELLRKTDVIGGTKNGEGVAEKIGYAEGIKPSLLSKIDRGVKRAEYDEGLILGFSHSHMEMEMPSGKDIYLMKHKYPKVLHIISVQKGEKIYAFNGDCDLLSIKDGTLSPEEGLLLEYRNLPYNPDVERLRSKILGTLRKRMRRHH